MQNAATIATVSDALIRLLAHDLRSPLGPIALATSALEDDETLRPDQRELARMAGAHAARAARLIDAVLTIARGTRAPAPVRTDIHRLAEMAFDRYVALGGDGMAEGESCVLDVDVEMVRDALVSLMECAGGEGGRVKVGVVRDGAGARILIMGSDPEGCAAALTSTAPADWRSAFALSASAVMRAHGGIVASIPDGVLVLLGGAG
jgi:K+-sensing histidine kinase KdpD